MDKIAIKAAESRRLVLPAGGETLDGLGISPGADLPAEGAYVTPGVWTRKRLDEGDAVLVAQPAIDAAAKRRDPREGVPEKSSKKPSDGAQA